MTASPGFVFHCHRCGLCCRVGHGRVWVEPEDVTALATACGQSEGAFLARHVLEVDGRLSLRERPDGCCTLLEGGNQCTAYAARPEQCRSFPFWPELLEGGAALERAAGYCPGIQLIPERSLAGAVLPRAEQLLKEFGAVTREESAPHLEGERWISSLEADLLLAGRNPAPLVDSETSARARLELERLAEATGYPWSIGLAPRLLAERAAGWETIHGGPPLLPD